MQGYASLGTMIQLCFTIYLRRYRQLLLAEVKLGTITIKKSNYSISFRYFL